jgi:hypothetical protein
MSEADLLNEPAPPPTPRRRRRWGCLVVILVLFGACGGFYAIMMHSFDADLNAAIAETDRLEPDGWTLDQIEAHRKAVPDEENAALVVQALKSKLGTNWPQRRTVPAGAAPPPAGTSLEWVMGAVSDLPPPVQLDADLLSDMRRDIKDAADKGALDEAHKLPKLRDGRFPITYSRDFVSTTIARQDARAAANVLQEEAVLLAQDGQADKALEATRGVVVSGRAVGDEPLLVSALIRLSCQAMAVQTLERVLALGEPSDAELKKIQELLELEAGEPLLLNGIRGERAGDHQLMLALKSGEAKFSSVTGRPGTGVEDGIANVAGRTLAQGSHARLLRLMNDYVAAAKLPPEEQGEAMKQLDNRVKKAKVEYDVVIALLMPAMSKVSESYRRNQAGLRCAIVAVAAERFRRDNRRWPQTPDELTRDYLKAVPNDPYDGKPLRYKRLADGVIIYSVGPDKEDNGGARNIANPLAKKIDYGFRLWDVASRRQPPAEVLPMPQEAFGAP